MPDRLLLEGEYEDLPPQPDPIQERIARLEDKVASMRQSVQQEAVVLLMNVLHQAMRDVAAGKYKINPALPATASGDSSGKWDAIKQRNPGRVSEAIDVLMIHGSMSTTQLAAAMRMNRTNCYNNVVNKMDRMGLLVKNGNAFSLKEL